jgi:hypothetical protein
LVVELAEELSCCFRTGNFVAQHLVRPRVFAQPVEVVQAFAAQRVPHQEALHIAGFVESALALLQMQRLLDGRRHMERTDRPHKQGNAGVAGQALLQWLRVEFKQEVTFRG